MLSDEIFVAFCGEERRSTSSSALEIFPAKKDGHVKVWIG